MKIADENFVAIAAVLAPDNVWDAARLLKIAALLSGGQSVDEPPQILVPPGTVKRALKLSPSRLMGLIKSYQEACKDLPEWHGSPPEVAVKGMYKCLESYGGQATGGLLNEHDLKP